MNGQDPNSRVGMRKSVARLDIGNIIGDPFALATISIGALAWLIAFISSIIADSKFGSVPNFTWWATVYMLCCIVGVTLVFCADSINSYNVAVVGFLAAGLTFSTSAANNLIYVDQAAANAAAAGHLLLCMIQIVWIFYFGTSPKAMSHAYIDSFALNKDNRHGQRSQSTRPLSHSYGAGRPDTSASSHLAPQMYTSAQLGGFEQSPAQAPNTSGPSLAQKEVPPANMSSGPTPPGPNGQEGEVSAPTEYPYQAKAIYSYDANPEDANEISFTKHEILEVSDVSGRWWQARKANGETGIAPSNYLILL